MVKHSAGIVLWRETSLDGEGEVLLVHPGGPYWAGKNEHAWSIPKGEFAPGDEVPEACARREFAEELGTIIAADVKLTALPIVKAAGKHIYAFAAELDFDPTTLCSNTTEIEWPPRSGRVMEIPEVDAAAWIGLADAERFLHKGQAPLVGLVRAVLRESLLDRSD